jgi:hypothetical protein
VKTSKPAIAISLLIIGLGVGWLLNTLKVFGGQIDWVWVSALGISGLLLLVLAKLDRFNFVVGTSLVICSILSLLRYMEKLSINLEAPILFISVGLLLLLSHVFRLPSASELPPETLGAPPGSTASDSTPTDPKL